MASVTRRIGLSLGADICWPMCYEELVRRLDLRIPYCGDEVDFKVERLGIEPFQLRRDDRWDLVIDRLTHWYPVRREWIKKAVLLDDLYVFNNPWTVQSMEKHTAYCAMTRLGFPVPETVLLPPKSYKPSADLDATLRQYARMFELDEIGDRIGYPCYLKPFDGGGWRGVTRVDSADALQRAYDDSGMDIMHLQAGVEPFDEFVRCVGLGSQTRLISYDPSAPLHDRYTLRSKFTTDEQTQLIRDMTLVINAFFGWDYNSCEALLQGDTWFPIDFANPCPDAQVTSLHYHFPWLLTAKLKWSLFAAATRRRVVPLHWGTYFRAAEEGGTFREKLDRYVRLAHLHFATDEFEAFCARHLAHLDEVVHEFFGSEVARDAIRQKVVALYPDHEVESFTDLFWDRIQQWRSDAAGSAAPTS